MNDKTVPGDGKPIDAQALASERAASWAPGVMQRINEAAAPAFTCVVCTKTRNDAGVLFGGGTVCAQCALEAVRDRLVASGRAATMKHVELPRTTVQHEDGTRMVTVPDYVKRHEGVTVRCTGKHCPDPIFTATFDEIVREIECPTCKRLTPTPTHTWGNP